MSANKLDTDYYVISDDFKLLDFNKSVKDRYKGIQCGALCYQATMKRDTPCPHCPIAGNSESSCPIYYDPFHRDWVQAVFSDIGQGIHAVICHPVGGDSKSIFDRLKTDDIPLSGGIGKLQKEYDNASTGMIGGYCEDGFPLYYVNEAMIKMLGYDDYRDFKKGIDGKVVNTIHPEDLPQVQSDLGDRYYLGQKYETTYRMPKKDGTWFWTVDRGEVIETADGRLAIISVCMDVSKEQELREREERASEAKDQLLSDITKMLYGYNLTVNLKTGKYTIIEGNGMAESVAYLKKFEDYDTVYRTFCASTTPEYRKRAEELLNLDNYRGKSLKTGLLSTEVFYGMLPKGSMAWQEVNVIAGFDRSGDPILHILGRDVTEAREKADTKAQLEIAKAASAAKSAFLFNMSHDIRTPMNAILGFAGLMEKEINNPEKLKDYLEKIKVSGDSLLMIINNVLEISYLDSGKDSVNETIMDLMEDGLQFMPLFENQLKAKNLTITHDMDITHQYIYADVAKIRNITMNLISNAIKYTPEGGKIALHFCEYPSERAGYAVYEEVVSDTGIGMSRDFQEHIFETFTREHDTTESKVPGMGLGMSIVKRYVDLMGGHIEVESELGKGSTFRVILEHRLAAGKASASPAEPADIRGRRILLAEDNDLNAEIAVTILEEAGAKVERAADGRECIDMLLSRPAGYFDLILMDIQMPKLNGYQATREIRSLEDRRKASIPIIAMTANAFEEDRQNALAVGMDEHLAKPINIQVLLNTLTDILR